MMNIFWIILSYFIGNISGSLILGKLLYQEDIRKKGSGNAGTTNAVRIYGMKFGIMTFVIDFLKGLFIGLLGKYLGGNLIFWMSLAVVLGHNFPLFFKFKGGKGIATSFGVLIVLSPGFILILLGIFLLLVFKTRLMSLGSIVASIIAFGYGIYLYPHDYYRSLTFMVLAILALFRHHSNIRRLLQGKENTF
ncbi:MAG: glycerol-3-phosphate 1-O-acyltransferase PlsY [Tissierellia bacterium]|nr:glycerol-3-phosphate 1-O-acyltransferase PlsY [Tissierellia bacterium]